MKLENEEVAREQVEHLVSIFSPWWPAADTLLVRRHLYQAIATAQAKAIEDLSTSESQGRASTPQERRQYIKDVARVRAEAHQRDIEAVEAMRDEWRSLSFTTEIADEYTDQRIIAADLILTKLREVKHDN